MCRGTSGSILHSSSGFKARHIEGPEPSILYTDTMLFGRYDPHYLLLPHWKRQDEPMYMKIWKAVMRYDIAQLRGLARHVRLDWVTDANRNTLLHVSAMYGNLKAMSYLLTQRLDRPRVNASNIFGTTALHVALERVQSDRHTPDHEELLWLLLDAGADPRIPNGLGISALVTAAGCACPMSIFKIYERMCMLERNKNRLMRMLVHAGWSLRQFLWTKDVKLLKLMLRYDTEALKVPEAPESTPLHEALEERASLEVFKLLLDFGADPNLATVEHANTALHKACELSGKWDNLDIVRLLLDKGADPNAPNAEQCTCFHTALTHGTVDLVNLLLSKGANVHAKDDTDNTSMHYAAFNGNVELIKMLVTFGLAIDVKNACGVTPLHTSSRRGRAEATEYLLHLGADVNWKDRRGWAALHYAVQSCTCEGSTHECIETIDILVDHGAELDVEKPNEKTALGLCIDSKNVPFGSLLIRRLAMVEPRDPDARALTVRLLEKNRALKDYYDRCVKEIKYLKNKTLYGRVSFYKALTCSQKELRAFLRNPEYVDQMNKLIHCDHFSQSFVIYRYRLTSRYVSAMNIQGPVNDAIEALCYLMSTYDRSDEVVTTIVSFLGTDELKVLGKCKVILEELEEQEDLDDQEEQENSS